MHFLPSQPKNFKHSSPSFQRNRLRSSKRFHKQQKGAIEGNWRYWVVVTETCRLPYDTLSGLRVLLRRDIDKLLDFKFYASFRVPVTSKPGLRMGTGKGKIKMWLAEFKKGQLMLSFEDIGGKRTTARIFRLLRFKLPVAFKIIRRNNRI